MSTRNSIGSLARVLEILQRYCKASDTFAVYAQSIVFAGPDPAVMSTEDRKELLNLGAQYDALEECWRVFG